MDNPYNLKFESMPNRLVNYAVTENVIAVIELAADSAGAPLEGDNQGPNTYTHEMMCDIDTAVVKARFNDSVTVIMFTGHGSKFFSAGASIQMLNSVTPGFKYNFCLHANETLSRLEQTSKLVVCCLNGHAVGGGLEIAMACDLRMASDRSKLGQPEINIGIIPGAGGTQRLTRLIGEGRAMEMITTAGMLSAEDAKQWGFVNHICEQEELISFAEKIASKIKRNSPNAIAKAIKSVNAGFIDGTNGFEVEKIEFGNCFGTPEFIEGTTAFMEKRKANF